LIASAFDRKVLKGEKVEHINGDTNDNTPSNLKIVTGSYKLLIEKQKIKNSAIQYDSNYGVIKRQAGYVAKIKHNGRNYTLCAPTTKPIAEMLFNRALKERKDKKFYISNNDKWRKLRDLPKGVYKYRGYYYSKLRYKGKTVYLCRNVTLEEAKRLYNKAKEEIEEGIFNPKNYKKFHLKPVKA